MPLVFEWDQRKARANLRKHRVSFTEAISVFTDPLAQIFEDEDNAASERRESRRIMKKTSQPKVKRKREDGLRPEYAFDYTKAKPNRFAGRVRPGAVAVMLEPDVARFYENGKSVNAVLRALMTSMPRQRVPIVK